MRGQDRYVEPGVSGLVCRYVPQGVKVELQRGAGAEIVRNQ